jgi:indoleamine 2,3-dioxygenase
MDIREEDYSLPVFQRMRKVFTSLVHLYVHSHPVPSSNTSIKIPEGIAVPLLQISEILKVPPAITYSDIVLYNWGLVDPGKPVSLDNVETYAVFGSAPADENHFYRISLLIELRGAEGIEIMSECNQLLAEKSLTPATAATLARKLDELTKVIVAVHSILRSMRDGCDPDKFYDHVRPWLAGSAVRPDGTLFWEFEKGDRLFDLDFPHGLFGATAGQSSLFQALDIFLGVDGLTHAVKVDGASSVNKPSFLDMMKPYMPFQHRRFLDHLSGQPIKIRDVVSQNGNEGGLTAAYNRAIDALKEFRNQHIRIVTLYIVQPARRQAVQQGENGDVKVVGTGGSSVLPALKGIRDGNASSVL